MQRATVIIPTFDHGAMLERAVASALAQDWPAFEVVVICDGAPPSTRTIVDGLAASDPRVTYRWCAKGERLGELHRNDVLASLDTDFVCYLSDDDLWAPNHLSAMAAALEQSDVAHTNHLYVDGEGKLHAVSVNLNDDATRQAHLGGTSFVCLSAIGHTMAAVRDRGLRWRLTPTDRYTDWYFLTGAIELGLRFGATNQVTMLNIASIFRRGWSEQHRLDEIDAWLPRMATGWPERAMETLISQLAHEVSHRVAHQACCSANDGAYRTALEVQATALVANEARIDALESQLAAVTAQLVNVDEAYRRSVDELGEAERQQSAERQAREANERRLAELTATKLVRLQQHLARNRVVRSVMQWRR